MLKIYTINKDKTSYQSYLFTNWCTRELL